MIGRKANVGGFLNPPWMRKNMNSHLGRMFSDRKWIVPFFASLLISVTLLLTATLGLFIPSQSDEPLPLDAVSFANEEDSSRFFIEPELRSSLKETSGVVKMEPPRLAYLISGTKGDIRRMMRTLQAVYHPRNQYVLHMDLEAPPRERLELTNLVKADSTFNEVENVRVMAQSNLVTYKGPTMIACTLQAISVLLRESLDWDWFINLSASDYPLMTQDGVTERNRSSSIQIFTYPKSWNLLGQLKDAHFQHPSSCLQGAITKQMTAIEEMVASEYN